MESHEILKAAFDNTSPKAVASELGVSLSLVYKWAQDQSNAGSGSRNPLDRLIEIYKHTEHVEIIEWVCNQAGGYFVKDDAYSYAEQAFDVLPATNEILRQFSTLLLEVSKAASDNTITPDEASEIRDQWNKLKGYTEGFVKACEDGDFELIKKTEIPKTIQEPKPRTRLY